MRVIFAVIALAAGCGGDGGDGSPTSDAATSSDASSASDAPSGAGLRVVWNATEDIPGTEFENNVESVMSASFFIDRLEVLSDGGPPTLTTARDFPINWGTSTPSPNYFDQAPPGIYSQVKIDIDMGGAASFDIFGMVDIGGTIEPFHLTSTEKLEIDLDMYQVTLLAGSEATVVIDLDLDEAFGNINWAMLPLMSGVRTLDDSSPQIDSLKNDVEDSFTRP